VARIVVTRLIPEPGLELLRTAGEVWVSPHDRAMSVDELHAAVAGADAAVTLLHDRVDEAFLRAASPRLRVVANVAVGYDNVDVPAATRHGVLITNTPGVLTDATADLAIALILMVTRRLAEGERLIRARKPWRWSMFMLLGSGLQGKTLGIVGLGAIGQATARRARAFGMEIAYTQRTRAGAELETELGGARYLTLDELLASADIVSLHAPLTEQTHHLINAARLREMKRSAYLVNTSRGPVIDEAALARALRDGVIAGAALDVFEREPEVDEALLALDNVVLVPHLGSATLETRTAMAVLAARNVVAVLADEHPPTPVNESELARGRDTRSPEPSTPLQIP
jgi:lactate dehydrogenase-like 2-hydroxyacid dehydrogenase